MIYIKTEPATEDPTQTKESKNKKNKTKNKILPVVQQALLGLYITRNTHMLWSTKGEGHV